MQIRVKAGEPDIRLNGTEVRKLREAHQIVEALAVYAQDSLAEDAREPLAAILAKYDSAKGEETA